MKVAAVGPVGLAVYVAYGIFLACRDGQCFEAVTAEKPIATKPAAEQTASEFRPTRVVVQLCNS